MAEGERARDLSILAVDDRPENLLAIEATLEPLGLTLVRAGSGREALRRLLGQEFALIILDVAMPEMDGFETAALIRQHDRHRHTPIMFLTARRDPDDIVRGYALGAADYVAKPVEPEMLRSKVTALVQLHRDLDEESSSISPAILVVDDEPANRLAVECALASLREEVVTAGSGEEALALLETREFAVMLLDVRLPGIDGFETAAAIRANRGTVNLPIIMMSSVAQASEDVLRGYAVGAVDYLFPPVEPAVLRSKVGAFTELFKRREMLRLQGLRISELKRLETERLLEEERSRTLLQAHGREIEAQRARVALELSEARSVLVAELHQKNQELGDLTQELDAFARSVSHDLRAPLRAIDGFSRALAEDCSGELGPQGRDHLRQIQESCSLMGSLIEALLGLSRVARADLEREAVDLTALGREVLERLGSAAPGRRVETVVDDGMTAEGDRRLLLILLENLLGNAWKFTARKPMARIEFVVADPGKPPVFVVRDDGAGFDGRYADRLFQPFRRLHSKDDFEGTGIGLATAQRVVRRHGGRIWAEGELGKGAAFYFTIGETGANGRVVPPARPPVREGRPSPDPARIQGQGSP